MSVPTRAILVYKAPQRGRVKTRLAKTIGDQAALELYRWMGRRQLEVIPSEWEIEIRFSPDDQKALMRSWLGVRLRLEPQGKGDLGERMERAAASCFHDDVKRKAIFLGADCVDIDASVLKEAESRLERADVVLGPASDGGYYLVGMKERASALFEGIKWGSESVLPETINRIRASGKQLDLLEELVDVDDWEGLVSVRDRVDASIWKRLSLPGD